MKRLTVDSISTLPVQLHQDKFQHLRKYMSAAMNNLRKVCKWIYAECAQGTEIAAIVQRIFFWVKWTTWSRRPESQRVVMDLRLGKVLKLNKFLLVLNPIYRQLKVNEMFERTVQEEIEKIFLFMLLCGQIFQHSTLFWHFLFGKCTQTRTTLHCRGQLLPSIHIRDSQADPGLILGDIQHCQSFIMKYDRLWAGWVYMISAGAVLISGKKRLREFLKLWRGLEGTSKFM